MQDFLAAHMTYVHPSVPKPAKAKAQKSNLKKKGKLFAGDLLPTIKVKIRAQPQVKQGKGVPKPKIGYTVKSLRGLRVGTSSSNSGSSMFGGVKYATVRVFSGGLPGLGKRR